MPSILKRPSGKYRVQVRTGGRSLCRTFSTLSDARRWSKEQEVAIERGEVEPRPTGTLGDLLDRYALEVSPHKKGAAQEVARLKLLKGILGTEGLGDLRSVVLTFKEQRLGRVTSSTVRRDLDLLRHVVATARRDWGVPVGWPDVSMPPPPKARSRRPSQAELEALLGAAHPRLRAAITLLIQTGMRRGELLSARWVDVDWGDRTLHLHDSKNGQGRLVPLSSKALEVLAGLPRDDLYILPLSANALRLGWQRLKAKLGIKNLRMHDLRREAASRAFEKGLSLPEVRATSSLFAQQRSTDER